MARKRNSKSCLLIGFGSLKSMTKKAETLSDEIHKEGGLEKGDLKALILSAFAVFLPIALGILLLFVLVAWAFTGFAT